MQGTLTARGARAACDARGAAAIIVALSMVALLTASALVLDLGLVRIDRQVDKSAADSAVLAGLQGLDGGDGKAHAYTGVCTAIRWLRVNDRRFAGLLSTSGTWRDGNGAVVANGCTDTTLQKTACRDTDRTTWASFTWTGSFQGTPLRVRIESAYPLPSTAAGASWKDDTLPAALTDSNDNAGGCDQLAVSITQNRKPGLGSIARSADLATSIRSVGRVEPGTGDNAPALLLLKRTGCTSLEVGSSAGSSWVKVYGTYSSTTQISQPGTIHSDADGTSCSTSVFYGKAANGIIAYAAPLASGLPDPAKPGQVTSVAGMTGLGTAYDSLSNVYASTLLTGTGGAVAPSGRPLVTRAPVDGRYLQGVTNAMAGASSLFSTVNAGNANSLGWRLVSCSSGTVTSLGSPALTAADKLFVHCGNLKSIPQIDAGTVAFDGTVSPSATISMPNASHVYIWGPGDAIDLSTGGTFSMYTNGNLAASDNTTCTDQVNVGKQATLFVKSGDIKETGGLLQMCNTTVFMMGGQADGCAPSPGYLTTTPATVAPAPTQTPCGGTSGDGQIKQTGGGVDWTAPNTLDRSIDGSGNPLPAALAAWADPNGPEDLALWDESAGNSSSNKFQFTGGGTMHMQGIFMTPNADPVSLSGNANFTFKNAQFVATSVALASNNTTLSMTVDPNAAVTMPQLHPVGLVR